MFYMKIIFFIFFISSALGDEAFCFKEACFKKEYSEKEFFALGLKKRDKTSYSLEGKTKDFDFSFTVGLVDLKYPKDKRRIATMRFVVTPKGKRGDVSKISKEFSGVPKEIKKEIFSKTAKVGGLIGDYYYVAIREKNKFLAILIVDQQEYGKYGLSGPSI